MELKNFFAQDLQGNVIPSPTVYFYQPDTTTLATGLKDDDGNALTNPFTGATNGHITVAAPDGDYDMRVVGAGRDSTMRVRFIDSVAGSAEILRLDLASTASGKGSELVSAVGGSGTTAFTTVKGFIQKILSSVGSALVGFVQAGAGAVTRTAQDKMREFVSVKDFGAVGDGVTNDYAAFAAAIAASLSGVYPYQSSGRVYVPPGTYFMETNTLTLTAQVTLFGDSEGQQTTGTGRCTLKWSADTAGIVCQKAWGPSTSGCDGSVLQGLYLLGGGGSGSTAHGIDVAARVVVRDCYVKGFRGNGINIVASSASNKNANNWRLDNVTCESNNGHGVYVQGMDANAGLATLVDCTGNGGWGIYDSSFLGNTWLGCHTSANILGAYKTDNANARSVFLGCYSETGQPASSVIPPSIYISGLNGAGVSSGTLASLESSLSGLSAGNMAATASDGVGTVSIGKVDGSSSSAQMLKFERAGVSGSGAYRLKHATGLYYIDWANLGGGYSPVFFYDRNHVTTGNGFARDITSWTTIPLGLPNGYFDSGMRARVTLSAAPASGSWLQGDIVYNSNPVASGFIGWVCVAAGSPGTWKTFGAISA